MTHDRIKMTLQPAATCSHENGSDLHFFQPPWTVSAGVPSLVLYSNL